MPDEPGRVPSSSTSGGSASTTAQSGRVLTCRACHFGHPNECEDPTNCNRRTAMPRYRKKPVVIDAHQWNGDDAALDAWLDALGVEDGSGLYGKDDGVCIDTLEGTMTASPGDWIIRGVQGEFYPCKPDIFEQTYEAVDA